MFRFLAVFFALGSLSTLYSETLCIEAEQAEVIEEPIKKEKSAFEDESEVSGEVLGIVQGSGEAKDVGGKALIKFTLKEDGKYILWSRAWWLDRCGNSVAISIDGGKPFSLGNDGTYKVWHWVKAKGIKLKLKKGEHTLEVLNREDGIYLDQFLLTTRRRYVPVGIEE